MNVVMVNFCRRNHGTYYRSFTWGRELARAGHRVTVLCAPAGRGLFAAESREAGVRILETPGFLDPSWLMSRLSGLTGWGGLDILARVREVRRERPDILQLHEHHPNVVVPAALAGGADGPVLLADWVDHYGPGGFRDEDHFRFDWIYRPLGAPFRRMVDGWEGGLRRRARAVTVISGYLARRAESLGVPRDRIHVIPGGADVEAVRPLPKAAARARLGFAAGDLLLGFLGSYQGDVDLAIEAVARLSRRMRNVRFLLIGRRNRDLEELAALFGIADRVVPTGWVESDELPWVLAAVDAFMIPMRDNRLNEARWPNKIGEYMAAGRPTIATRVGDVAAVIEEERIGVTADFGATPLAEAAEDLLADGSRLAEMGARAREVAERRFSLSSIGRRVEALYRSALAGRGGAGEEARP